MSEQTTPENQQDQPAGQPETPATPSEAPATQPEAATAPAAQTPAAETGEQAQAAAPAEQAPAGEAPAQAPEAQQRGRGGRDAGRSAGGRDRRGDRRPRDEEGGLESSVVRIYRCSKVVKGGRTFSFGALVVAGDRQGNIGIGYGKANEVPPAVEKATKDARKNLIKVNLRGSTIPHPIKGRAGASTVVLVPARPGTGVTAGKSVRPVLELAGITDILTKSYGSTSPKNLVKATLDALRRLQAPERIGEIRGVELPKGAGELVEA